MINPLIQLQDFGQSIWYDNIERRLLVNGELARMIAVEGVLGLTSNPSIFEKAISGSDDYDAEISALAAKGATAEHIYEALTIADIQMAADLLRPVYDSSGGYNGYASLEVSPHLAHDSEGTIADGRRLFAAVNRPNLMIKVPGTAEGVPAIEELIAGGINVNVTLLFSRSAYEEAAQAYIRGLERLAATGGDLSRVASVASFFVSRIDSNADRRIEVAIDESDDPARKERLSRLPGKIAIANSKLAYRRFEELFATPRFQALQAKGATVQRMLWASTSTKNPAYPPTMYVDELVGPETVNTVPHKTLKAFGKMGVVRGATVQEGLAEAEQSCAELAALGISLDEITAELLAQGVAAFSASYDHLLQVIEQKRAALAAA